MASATMTSNTPATVRTAFASRAAPPFMRRVSPRKPSSRPDALQQREKVGLHGILHRTQLRGELVSIRLDDGNALPGEFVVDATFLFETQLPVRPTKFALETDLLERDYYTHWQGLKKRFGVVESS